jgi:putative transcriptional regulator
MTPARHPDDIQHHPDASMLTAFAAGTLDHGQHVAIATHLVGCPRCRSWIRSMEQVGGAVLANLPHAAMSSDALARAEARLNETGTPVHIPAAPAPPEISMAGLPKFVRRYAFGDWQWVAPRVHLRPIALPTESPSRVFLLRSGPGTRMLAHSHVGIELTCVLSGAFSHDGGHFGPGDFDLGDETVDHRPLVDAGADCVCLVAMQGKLRLKGILGRLMQPFVRL